MKKKTNHAGGVLGGMSDGSVITFRAAFKPTPSIAQPQQTVNRDGKDTEIVIHGRHDPIIVPRAVVVVETMAAVTVLDLLLQNMGSRLDSVKTSTKMRKNKDRGCTFALFMIKLNLCVKLRRVYV